MQYHVEAMMITAPLSPVAIKIDSDIKARIKRLAEARNRTAHWLMREAISQYVEREEKRSEFRQDAVNAWEEFQATGLHASSAEVDTWLAQLEAGKDVEPPECHA